MTFRKNAFSSPLSVCVSFVFSVSFYFSPDSTILEVSKFTEKGDIGNDETFLIGLELGTSLKTSCSSFHGGVWDLDS